MHVVEALQNAGSLQPLISLGGTPATCSHSGSAAPHLCHPCACHGLTLRHTQALGPRAIPTAAAIESELQRLRVEEGRAAGGEDSGSDGEDSADKRRRRGTALARDPSDYFGFVG